MATTYTNELKEIVFLNNKNIAQKQEDLDTISYNAIPSLSLFNSTYSELTGKSNDIEISAYGISCQVNAVCGQISDEIKFQAENAKSYTEQLSTEFKTISGDLRGAVTVADKNNRLGHELSVIKLTNASYDDLVRNDSTQWNALYVIDDEYRDMRNQRIENLGDPVDSKDATTMQYVNSISALLSVSLVDKLSAYSEETSANSFTQAKQACAKYNDFDFKYDSTTHYISLTLKSDIDEETVKIDATDFIRSRIIDHFSIVDDKLIIFWKNAEEDDEFLEIPLDSLVTIYKDGDGIDITKTSAGFVISCDNSIARQNDLDAVSSDYISKTKNTKTSNGIYTEYLTDSVTNEGGIRVVASETPYNCTEYNYGEINILRNIIPAEQVGSTERYKFTDDVDGIVRFKDLATADYVPKSIIRSALQSISENSTFSDVITALLDLKAAVQTT